MLNVILLWASLVAGSKTHPVTARLLALVSLEGSIRLTSEDNFKDRSPTCCTLISSTLGLLETSTTLGPELQKILIRESEHVLAGITGCKGSLSTTARR